MSLKYRLLDAPEGTAWPALAVQPLIIFPTGEAHLVSDQISFGLIGIASSDLPAALHVDVNAGLIAVGQTAPSGYLPQGLVSAVCCRGQSSSGFPFGAKSSTFPRPSAAGVVSWEWMPDSCTS